MKGVADLWVILAGPFYFRSEPVSKYHSTIVAAAGVDDMHKRKKRGKRKKRY